MEARMADLTLDGVRKSFGETPVLQALDLAVPDGGFCVVVGPSGCGKSTLLRLVAGLETADAGRILIGGRDVTRLPPKARSAAMVFQNYALLPHLSVARNIAFGMEIRGTPRADIAARVADTARILRLEAQLDRKPRQLSGGQRQRVAMGRAIVRDPQVFLFDEPLSNLDAQLRAEMRAEIKALHARLGATALYVTHDQIEAMTMGDILVVLNGGRVEQIGPPEEIYRRPASTFVARFIGAPPMNLIPSTTAGSLAAGAPARGETLGIRPEHLKLAPGAGVEATARRIEPHGADTFIQATTAEGVDLTIRLPAGNGVRAGDQLPLLAPPAHLHHFGADGRRIA